MFRIIRKYIINITMQYWEHEMKNKWIWNLILKTNLTKISKAS